MKAIVFSEPGGIEKLKYVEDFPKPVPKKEEVLLAVKAASLNHLDIWIRNGIPSYGSVMPHISGCDIAGVVEGTGEEVIVSPGLSCGNCEFCQKGRENICKSFTIIGAGPNGGFAEYCVVPKKNLIPKPKNLSFEEAAAFPLTFLTAWHMLRTRAQLTKGQTVLILGASSGIGVAAVQIAKLTGATVIATAGSVEKLEKIKKLGADHLLNHREEAWDKKVKELTQGVGVDVVFEHIGPVTWEKSIKSIKKGGTLVTCGATTGPVAETDLRYLYSRELSIHGAIMGTKKELEEVTQHVARGNLKPVIDSVFPLKEIAAAQKKMESREFFGKIVISIS
ncbi:MAG: zinc-binding dehydrogenase [bacterium]|nr:zinc-binding dehydrogenase [bacterium]